MSAPDGRPDLPPGITTTGVVIAEIVGGQIVWIDPRKVRRPK